MKRNIALLGLAFALQTSIVLADTATQATNKPGVAAVDYVTITATVENVNKKTREVTLKGENGQIEKFIAGPQIKNFKQLKKGDIVTIEYTQPTVVYVAKSDEALEKAESSTLKTAELGQKPGMEATYTASITAQVEAIDKKARTLTLRGPGGNVVTFKVSDEVKRFNEIKKGDKITAQYAEAVAVSVRAPEKK